MFGEWGGLILQFTITIAVVLGLVAVVYWLVRRYSSGGLGRIGRGRVPRLAIIDAMAVDGRRRLVLIRRDNVEHLVLIGGPTDIVVEQAIQRPRQRQAPRPQPMSAETSAEPPAVVADNPPIPFPQARVHQPAPTPPPAHRPEPLQPVAAAPPSYQPTPAPAAQYQSAPQPLPIERPFSPIRRTQQHAPRPDPIPAPSPATVVQFEPMMDAAPLFPELPPAELAQEEEPPAFIRRLADGNGAAPFDFATNGAASPFETAQTENAEETAAKVNDLEREMARLLGEITAKRPS